MNLNSCYHALILNPHHGNTKNKLGNGLYLHARSHIVEDETLGRGPKGGGKEELGEEE